MAKKTKSKAKRYFTLGKGAASFTDTTSGVFIRAGQTVSIDSSPGLKKSTRLKAAIKNGHVVELESADGEVVDLTARKAENQAIANKKEDVKPRKTKKEKEVAAEEDEEDEEKE